MPWPNIESPSYITRAIKIMKWSRGVEYLWHAPQLVWWLKDNNCHDADRLTSQMEKGSWLGKSRERGKMRHIHMPNLARLQFICTQICQSQNRCISLGKGGWGNTGSECEKSSCLCCWLGKQLPSIAMILVCTFGYFELRPSLTTGNFDLCGKCVCGCVGNLVKSGCFVSCLCHGLNLCTISLLASKFPQVFSP